MAVLAASLIFAALFQGELSHAGDSVDHERSMALAVIKDCDFLHAERVADKLNEPLKTSFKLAFLSSKALPTQASPGGPHSVRWVRDSETWRDEASLSHQQQCKRIPVKLENIPIELLRVWFNSKIKTYDHAPAQTRKALRLIKHWSLVNNVEGYERFPLTSQHGLSGLEACEVHSITWTQATQKTSIANWFDAKCVRQHSEILGYARIKSADQLMKSGAQANLAHRLYSIAQQDFGSDDGIQGAILYRVAMAAAKPLSLDAYFPAAFLAMRTTTLDPVYREFLLDDICEKLASPQVRRTRTSLLKAFNKPVALLNQLVLPCLERDQKNITAKTQLLRLALDLRNQMPTGILGLSFDGKLLALALQVSKSDTTILSQRLALAGEGTKDFAANVFWTSVAKSNAPWAKHAIAIYRKKPSWSDFDKNRLELILKNRFSHDRQNEASPTLRLRADKTETAGSLRLDDFRIPPPIQWTNKCGIDFASLFETEMRSQR